MHDQKKYFYFDSNIYRIIFPDHPFYNNPLHEALEKNKELYIIYSEAHLFDLKDSKPEYLEKDLKQIEKYALNHFIYKDLVEQKVKVLWKTPIEAFNEYNFSAYNDTLKSPFDIETLSNELGESDPKIIELRELYSKKLSECGVDFNAFTPYKEHMKLLSEFIPNFSNDMTIGEMMNNIHPYVSSLFVDQNKTSELRKYVTMFMNENDYNFANWKFDFNTKFKETPLQKTFLEYVDSSLVNDQVYDFYTRFTHAYCALELLNITKEKSGGKTKKFTYDSLHRDAMHAYYGTFTNYLVTDDKGLQMKAYILYQLFEKSTDVLSSEDFIKLQ